MTLIRKYCSHNTQVSIRSIGIDKDSGTHSDTLADVVIGSALTGMLGVTDTAVTWDASKASHNALTKWNWRKRAILIGWKLLCQYAN